MELDAQLELRSTRSTSGQRTQLTTIQYKLQRRRSRFVHGDSWVKEYKMIKMSKTLGI